eukprot:GFUD01063859.1.p1 GENE.GFUD01063859.1~~GFUD01063859.1.p1  ORF type:complete len:210 (+),score=57.45 GFUD01063859.1:58-630(+)
MYILLCGYAPFSGNCGLDCGWERGESCTVCQEMLFSSIKEEELVLPEQHWGEISTTAKDLVKHLLIKDSSIRLDAEQVLDHPWIVNGGSNNTLQTPTNLKRQVSIKDLEDFASRAMAINRAVEEEDNSMMIVGTAPVDIPVKRETCLFNLSPPDMSTCSLLQRRRRSRERFSKFASIDELGCDFAMRAIC